MGATGLGEALTRALLSFRGAVRAIRGDGLEESMRWALEETVEEGAEVGIIALGPEGPGIGLSNRPNMPWATWCADE